MVKKLGREFDEALEALVASGRCTEKELEAFSDGELELLARATAEYLSGGESLTIKVIRESDRNFSLPSVEKFVTDPEYLGNELGYLEDEAGEKRRQIFDFWIEELTKIYAGDALGRPYTEINITGAIGIGKTTAMNVIQAFDLADLLSLKNPQRHYNLMPSTTIVLAFFSILKDRANDVGYSQFQTLLDSSPFFQRNMYCNPRLREGMRWQPPTHRRIAFRVGSRISHTLGLAVFSAQLDEANFGTDVTDKQVDEKKSQVYNNYTSLLRRKESRFMTAPGHFCIGSSKRSTADFLERHIESQKGKPGVYVIDAAQYTVKKGTGQYSGKMFRVLLGDLTREPRILQAGEKIKEELKPCIIDIPVEHQKAYEMNIIDALRDISGIAAQPRQALFTNRDAIRALVGDRKSPWKYSNQGKIPCTINVSFRGNDQIADFLIEENLFLKDGELPYKSNGRYLFIDTGYSGDAAGIGMVCRGGIKMVEQEGEVGEKSKFFVPKYWTDFYIRVKGKDRDQFPLYKLTEFVKWLVARGVDLRGVATDGHQSVQLRQDLMIAFPSMNVVLLSVDKDDASYLNLRNVAYAGALDGFYADANILTELFDLVHIAPGASGSRSTKMIVDHPSVASDGMVGRKDVADSLAGALFLCKDLDRSMSTEEIAMQVDQLRSADLDAIIKKAEGDVDKVFKDLDALNLSGLFKGGE